MADGPLISAGEAVALLGDRAVRVADTRRYLGVGRDADRHRTDPVNPPKALWA